MYIQSYVDAIVNMSRSTQYRTELSADRVFPSINFCSNLLIRKTAVTMSNKAAFIETEKGSVVVREADIVQPGEGEILVKVYSKTVDAKNKRDDQLIQAGASMRYSTRGYKSGQTGYVGPGIPNRSRQSSCRDCRMSRSWDHQFCGRTASCVWNQNLHS